MPDLSALTLSRKAGHKRNGDRCEGDRIELETWELTQSPTPHYAHLPLQRPVLDSHSDQPTGPNGRGEHHARKDDLVKRALAEGDVRVDDEADEGVEG